MATHLLYSFLVSFQGWERERGLMDSKVIERLSERYDLQEVEFGTVYKWRPLRIMLECECGERVALTASETACEQCGVEHASLVQQEVFKELSGDRLEGDEEVHPWRYAGKRQDAGIPF